MKTVAMLRARAVQCRDRLQQLEQLQMIEERSQRAEGARAMVRAAAGAAGEADLEARLKAVSPGVRVEMRRRTNALGDGWTVCENEFELEDAPLEPVLEAVTALEQERPPWRLSACDIRASASTPGNGHVVLILTRLQPEG